MSKKWNIMAIKLGTLDLFKAVVTSGIDFNKPIREGIWAYAVWNDEHKILCDTGVHSAQWVTDYSRPCFQAEDETLKTALKKGLGWSLEDVDIVINTHLHYDHCGGNMYLPNATFYVQREEYENGFTPIKNQRQFYCTDLYDSEAIGYFRWKFLNGDADILPGISVLYTPGHCKGHQVVLIDTEDGVCCVTGDVAGILQNFSRNTPNMCSIRLQDQQLMDSIERIAMYADFALPMHDPNIEKYQTKNWPRIKDLLDDKWPLKYEAMADANIPECVYIDGMNDIK